MTIVKVIALIIIAIFATVIALLAIFQKRLIFHPTRLSSDYKFKNSPIRQEIFIKTEDNETINALFFPGRDTTKVILYFHGNAGDLSGWQHVAEDLLPSGLSVFIIDYRGYGKSSGTISEQGLYRDGKAALRYLIDKKNIEAGSIIIYGRSIGSGVAVEIAAKHQCGGVVLESAYTTLGELANEKLPFLFPSLYLRTKFNNLSKLNSIKAPIAFIHGASDDLIPPMHSKKLYEAFKGRKKIVLIDGGQHNDLHAFDAFQQFVATLPNFFFDSKRYQFHDN